LRTGEDVLRRDGGEPAIGELRVRDLRGSITFRMI